MNKEIKEKWIAALTSGNYCQTTDMLKGAGADDNMFCATGVLADIYAQEKGLSWTETKISPEEVTYPDCDTVAYLEPSESEKISSALGKTIRKWAQITPQKEEVVVDLNDSHGFDFNQIAKYIKEEL